MIDGVRFKHEQALANSAGENSVDMSACLGSGKIVGRLRPMGVKCQFIRTGSQKANRRQFTQSDLKQRLFPPVVIQ